MSTICSICLEDLEDQTTTLKCQHVLHTACFLDVVKTSIQTKDRLGVDTIVLCPLCRALVLGVPNNSMQTSLQTSITITNDALPIQNTTTTSDDHNHILTPMKALNCVALVIFLIFLWIIIYDATRKIKTAG